MRELQPLGAEIENGSESQVDRVFVVRISALRRCLQGACKPMDKCQESPWVVIIREPEVSGQEG